ncbi:MAG TPA: efflux RND transporter periplasmic adaptor subunit, partial [Gemmatimonadaceae bacterium]|nr:efflux RND transporter periplasmic adaptor subunit [Gemmatimonadaceae bacterium]
MRLQIAHRLIGAGHWFFSASVAAALLVAVASCGRKTDQIKDAASDSMSAMKGMTGDTTAVPAAADTSSLTLTAAQIEHGKIQWAPAEIGQLSTSAVIPGTLIPNENRTARLSAPAEGRVITVRVQPGDRVGRGQLLVSLVGPGAGSAQSDVSKAAAQVVAMRAQAGYAQAARERAERLLALKAIPRQDFERAIADDESAKANLSQALSEQRRAISSAEQLGAGASATGEMVLRSPLSGVVLSRDAQPGAVVAAGTQLISVTDPSSLWLQVNAPEKLASLFRIGGVLHFSVPAYPADKFDARVSAVGAALDANSRTLLVRATVLNGNQKLKPEMLASVSVEGEGTTSASVVPDGAIQLFDGRPTVFIVKPNNIGGATFTRRTVEIGPRTGSQIAVIRGLAAGELVVTAGAFSVKAEIQKR